jgi:hypothetical protein
MTRIVIHEIELKRMTRGPGSPVGIYLARKALGVDRRARAHLAGHRRSGALEATLRTTEVFDTAVGPYVLIGTDATPRDQGRTKGNTSFAYPVPLETGRDPSGRQRGYRYAFLEPALREEFGQSFSGN